MAAEPSASVIRLAFLGRASIEEDELSAGASELHVAGNRFTNLHWLVPFRRLLSLDVRHNLIESCDGVECCGLLATIDVRDNRLCSAELLCAQLSACTRLELVDARHNPFSAAFSGRRVPAGIPLRGMTRET